MSASLKELHHAFCRGLLTRDSNWRSSVKYLVIWLLKFAETDTSVLQHIS